MSLRLRHRWFRRLFPAVAPVVRTMARALANRDQDLIQDLEQEGLVAIYMMAPEELEAARRPRHEAAGRAFRAMRRYRTRNRARYKRVESTDAAETHTEMRVRRALR